MTTRIEPSQFLRKASDIASFYGFRPADSIRAELPKENKLSKTETRNFERVAQACITCLSSKDRDAQLYYYASSTPSPLGRAGEGLPLKDAAEFNMSIIGAPGSIGEIVALKTLLAILGDSGSKVHTIRIGSAGDKDSQARFSREFGAYARKRAHDVPECCRATLGSDPLSLMRCASGTCSTIVAEGPRATGYLSERSRVHLREVLEYIERVGLPYELDDHLVHDEYAPRTLFSLEMEDHEGTIIGARGGRYDDHLRKMTGKKDASAVRATIYFRKRGVDRSAFMMEEKRKPAKVYFVKLGLEATLKGLNVLDTLRKARIPVYQSFSGDRLAPQLSEAERLSVPYLIIMGQREALQDAVIVRKVANRSQQMVRIAELPQFLRMV